MSNELKNFKPLSKDELNRLEKENQRLNQAQCIRHIAYSEGIPDLSMQVLLANSRLLDTAVFHPRGRAEMEVRLRRALTSRNAKLRKAVEKFQEERPGLWPIGTSVDEVLRGVLSEHRKQSPGNSNGKPNRIGNVWVN
jgi:hypothetical protein